jgi:hypothetical protein
MIRWTTIAGMRTDRDTFTYSICLFQIQLRIVAGLTPRVLAASPIVSIVAIRAPPNANDGAMLFVDALYGQRMIFVEPS